jgi:hypothetical protein
MMETFDKFCAILWRNWIIHCYVELEMCGCHLVTGRLQHTSFVKFKRMMSGPKLKAPMQPYDWILTFWTECNVEYFVFSRSCCLFMLIQRGTLRYVRRAGRFCQPPTSVITSAVTHLRTISQPLGHQNLLHNHGARNSDTPDTPNTQALITEWHWFLLTYLLVCDTVKWNRVISSPLNLL